jgi:hypothetical protein
MSCNEEIPTLEHKFTEGDLEDPIRVRWNQIVTTETSELAIDRPEPNASITVSGNLLDAETGLYEYPWSSGDLVAGEGQNVKARLTAAGRRKSTTFFKIDVEEDIT